eukprot:CAMPEP_0206031596 /NCGR_PEP_ID=MMETSP1464-20131121/48099_1 /ASSEMBLY_ACC=CAM_ASM_001124 /TAXON_ID=119497 /ORGANISM="Exanthemachrysis gayraliae, Strain RCC1523" /LENGTH=69 /DNA_ID=CAMNT_0053405707 /DNA_START=689 /DNA_END=896 /DNA_ORIENTATION=+
MSAPPPNAAPELRKRPVAMAEADGLPWGMHLQNSMRQGAVRAIPAAGAPGFAHRNRLEPPSHPRCASGR